MDHKSDERILTAREWKNPSTHRKKFPPEDNELSGGNLPLKKWLAIFTVFLVLVLYAPFEDNIALDHKVVDSIK
jgi:hypothetical protein